MSALACKNAIEDYLATYGLMPEYLVAGRVTYRRIVQDLIEKGVLEPDGLKTPNVLEIDGCRVLAVMKVDLMLHAASAKMVINAQVKKRRR